MTENVFHFLGQLTENIHHELPRRWFWFRQFEKRHHGQKAIYTLWQRESSLTSSVAEGGKIFISPLWCCLHIAWHCEINIFLSKPSSSSREMKHNFYRINSRVAHTRYHHRRWIWQIFISISPPRKLNKSIDSIWNSSLNADSSRAMMSLSLACTQTHPSLNAELIVNWFAVEKYLPFKPNDDRPQSNHRVDF